MLPDARQLSYGEMGNVSPNVMAVELDPFGDKTSIENAAAKLVNWGVDLVVMDCMGYTLEVKKMVSNITKCPVVLARSAVARVVAELI